MSSTRHGCVRVMVIPESGWTSVSSTWPGRPSVWRLPSKQWSPQLQSRIVYKKSTTSGPRHRRPRTESDNSKPWFQRSAIAQPNVEASGRGCGRPHNSDSRSAGRVASVDHVHICEDVDGHGTGRFGVGGRVVSSVGSRRDEVGQREEEVQPWVSDRAFEMTRQCKCGLRGVRSESRRTQVHSPPESTVTMSRVTVSQAHHQVQRMIPRLLSM